MRLQRLELAGFKSFPDRAALAFDRGVTAIVGPNGCGKSNVVDAITWVLGEQSARSLRGERMEDVIFGGSDARKPTATAEVRLKLSGVTAPVPVAAGGGGRTGGAADGNGHAAAADLLGDEGVAAVARDVELGRRLYRSGESEYLIDGEVCRLRDVQDLLMDAGVGVKAYAVIEQGKIGQILSARPTDRRQLIEEAAGVTKYKSRRRAAELKLEAAQQNLTRIDDIVFEVEKQRGALRRQAAKARRYRRLRDELRRWEKVLLARRYRALAEAIAATRRELAAAREGEAAAAAALAGREAALERVRLDLAAADSRATEAREAAHARELAIGRRQQQIGFDRQQVEALAATLEALQTELAALEARREPAGRELLERREAAGRAHEDRDRAAARLADEEARHAAAEAGIEGLESDVEAARSEVFAAINAATALRHAIEHAGAAGARIADTLAKLDVEAADLGIEAEKAAAASAAATEGLERARTAMEDLRAGRARREAELAAARQARDGRARGVRDLEQEIAGREARLQSLQELEAARAEYGDAARLVLAESNGDVGHLGSVADYLEVDRRYERAVDACLGDLLQHVVVRAPEHAAAGLQFVRDRNAGRCGFLIVEAPAEPPAAASPPPDGLLPISDVVRVTGPWAGVIQGAIGHAWIAETFAQAAEAARLTAAPVATLAGDLFAGARRITGGGRDEARGILATKRQIKELRETIAADREALARAADEAARLDAVVAETEAAIAELIAGQHAQEKAIVGLDLQRGGAAEETERLARKQAQIATERRQAQEEQSALQSRRTEAEASVIRLEADQRAADDRLTAAQRRLFEAREALAGRSRAVAEAKAAHAALIERAAALAAEAQRLEEASAELEGRTRARADDIDRSRDRRAALGSGIEEAERLLAEDLRDFDTLRDRVRTAEEEASALRAQFEAGEAGIRDARRALDEARTVVGRLEVGAATAESELSHLAASCLETVQRSLDEVAAEVAELERQGAVGPDAVIAGGDEDLDAADADRGEGEAAPAPASAPAVLTAEDAIAALREKIDRLGPVNMMAVEQFDELETRHEFLTAQRRDLVESIAATGEAIRRIDRTTRERFQEAFTAITTYFQETFSILFGGGRAGLLLLDETDVLESGIDIIAQPPGKRLQNMQLLSGGEKALTAMALMFSIFKYRPSPFCLLDEIDAPLDDANIGRFVEMLQGMQDRTQFILITHNRKTMEIADRLYGVTMEEPGVSKLISVQLN